MTSAISFYSPDILVGVICGDFVAWMHMPRKRRSSPITRYEPDRSLNVHPTDEVLSQNRDAWLRERLEVIHSIASQLRTGPSRLISCMVIVADMKISFTVCGHYSCQIIGSILLRLYFHNPPVLIPQLSEYTT